MSIFWSCLVYINGTPQPNTLYPNVANIEKGISPSAFVNLTSYPSYAKQWPSPCQLTVPARLYPQSAIFNPARRYMSHFHYCLDYRDTCQIVLIQNDDTKKYEERCKCWCRRWNGIDIWFNIKISKFFYSNRSSN